MKADGKAVLTVFKRRFKPKAILGGIVCSDHIRHVDRWHALQWVRGVRANGKAGKLEYDLIWSKTLPLARVAVRACVRTHNDMASEGFTFDGEASSTDERH